MCNTGIVNADDLHGAKIPRLSIEIGSGKYPLRRVYI